MSKRRVKSIVMHKRPTPNALEAKVDHLAKRVDELGKFAGGLITELNSLKQNIGSQLQINGQAIDSIDTNVLVLAEVLKEVFGQLTQIDEMLRLVDQKPENKTLDERIDADAIRVQAESWFKDTVSSAFGKIRSERAALVATQNAAKKEQDGKAEAARAQEELLNADTPSMSATMAGPGSDIPAGAQVFGG